MSVKIPDIPLAPNGYSIVGKKIMIHDISSGPTSITKLIDATDLGSIGGGTADPIVVVTRVEALDLVQNGTLIQGQKYLISDADANLYGGTPILISAATTSSFEIKGHGLFLNPDYQNISVWSPFSTITILNPTGDFEVGEIITDQVGGTATVYAFNQQTNTIYCKIESGSWFSSNSITGANSGAIADIDVASILSYPVDTKIVWGGKIWVNLNGNYGNTLDLFTLDDTEWVELELDDPSYLLSCDSILYDFENDEIVFREDILGNKVYNNISIKNFPWGNINVKGNIVKGLSVELINYSGSNLFNNTFGTNFNFTSPFFLGNSGFINCDLVALNSDGLFMVDSIFENAYINASLVNLDSFLFQNSVEEYRLTNSELSYKIRVEFNGDPGFGKAGATFIPNVVVPTGYSLVEQFVKVADLVSTDDPTTEVSINLFNNSVPNNLVVSVEDLMLSSVIKVAPDFVASLGDDYIVLTINNGDITSGSMSFILKFINA